MKTLISLLLIMMGVQTAGAQGAKLSIEPFKITAGETKEVTIDLTNEVDVRALQLDLTFPTSLTLGRPTLIPERIGSGDDGFGGVMESEKTVKANKISEGHYRFVVISTADAIPFAGNEGGIIKLTFKAASDIEVGYGKVTISGIEMVRQDGYTQIFQDDTETQVKLYKNFDITAKAVTGGTVQGTGSYEWDTDVTLTAVPDEGYSFVKWSDETTENPYTFRVTEAKEMSASFKANEYVITYMLDGVEFKKESVVYGSKIVTPEAPAKEGHTFAGWADVPETMPAKDLTISGSYTVNKYFITYMVDGEVYKKVEVEYGAAITAEVAPEKEGHTFSGWSEIPATMPAEDIVVTGTFSVNEYVITYMLDGVEFKKESVVYGSKIVTPEAPAKEGHTFAGWADVPETMPAKDLTISGSYTVNKYFITYMVDGEEYKKVEVEYGAAITAEAAPEKEGHTFSGWSEIPATMPAEDIVVTGTFTVNTYKITYMVDGEEYATAEAKFGEKIVPIADPVKEGYIFSGWQDVPETMPARDIVITGGFIVNSIFGIKADVRVDVYNLQGLKIKRDVAVGKLGDELPRGVYIINGRKVVIR